MATLQESRRDQAVAILKRAYAAGRIDHDEFDRRLHHALAARSTWELPIVLRGLLVEDARLRASVALRIAALKAGWGLASVLLLAIAVDELLSSGPALWLLVFPALWLGLSALCYRALRRARRYAAALRR